MPVRTKSIQKYGFASVSTSQVIDEAQSAYSAQTKASTAAWKRRLAPKARPRIAF